MTNAVAHDITERTYLFAVRIVNVVNAVPKSLAGGVVARQLIRAGTSIGANVHEARGASSKKEYCRRIKIAKSEAQETHYWLRLLGDCEILSKIKLNSLLQEADEIVRILTAIGKKTEE